jgi:hypothetical protein
MTYEILLNELSPADQAKALGLVYGGFGGWIDPKTRIVKARTVDGELVKVDDEEDGESSQDMGKINIFVLDHAVIKKASEDSSSTYVKKYNKIIKTLSQRGDGDMVILIERNTEREIADYLRKIGLSSGLKLTPLAADDPNQIREYVRQKIESGYTDIQYFDTDKVNINAVESLRAPYNKKKITIDTHILTKMDRK